MWVVNLWLCVVRVCVCVCGYICENIFGNEIDYTYTNIISKSCDVPIECTTQPSQKLQQGELLLPLPPASSVLALRAYEHPYYNDPFVYL